MAEMSFAKRIKKGLKSKKVYNLLAHSKQLVGKKQNILWSTFFVKNEAKLKRREFPE